MLFRGFNGTGKNATTRQQRPQKEKGAELCWFKLAASSEGEKVESVLEKSYCRFVLESDEFMQTAGWNRRPGRGRGAMLVGGASRGGGGGGEGGGGDRRERRRRRRQEHKWLRLVRKRTGQNAQTDTNMHVQLHRAWSRSLRSPAGIWTAPWWAELQWASTGPSLITSSRAESPLLLPRRLPSPLSVHVVKAESHRSTEVVEGAWFQIQVGLLGRSKGAASPAPPGP